MGWTKHPTNSCAQSYFIISSRRTRDSLQFNSTVKMMLYLDFDCTITTVGSLLDDGCGVELKISPEMLPSFVVTDGEALKGRAFGSQSRIDALNHLLVPPVLPEPLVAATPALTLAPPALAAGPTQLRPHQQANHPLTSHLQAAATLSRPAVFILSRSPTPLILLGLESVGIHMDPAHVLGCDVWEDQVPHDAPKWLFAEQHNHGSGGGEARPPLLVDDDEGEGNTFKGKVCSCEFQHVQSGTGLTVLEIQTLIQRMQRLQTQTEQLE